MFEKYGLTPNYFVVGTIEEEFQIIKDGDKLKDILLLYEFSNWLKLEKIPYWLRGTAGSSLIFYLLDITRGNPLPPHFYCSNCKSLYWLENYHSGFDVCEIRKCENDEQILVGDGHKIPWQSLWGYENNHKTFTVDLPIKSYEKIRKFWEDHKTNTIEKEDLPEDRERYRQFTFSNIECVFTIEYVNLTFYENRIDIDKTLEYFNYPEFRSPKVFSDLLYSFGFNQSTGVWTDKTRYMVDNLGMSLADMVAFREDIYYYLIKHDYSKEMAWRGAESFRKAKNSFEISEEMDFEADKWKLSVCQDIKFLFPKSHTLEYIIFLMKNRDNEDKYVRFWSS